MSIFSIFDTAIKPHKALQKRAATAYTFTRDASGNLVLNRITEKHPDVLRVKEQPSKLKSSVTSYQDAQHNLNETADIEADNQHTMGATYVNNQQQDADAGMGKVTADGRLEPNSTAARRYKANAGWAAKKQYRKEVGKIKPLHNVTEEEVNTEPVPEWVKSLREISPRTANALWAAKRAIWKRTPYKYRLLGIPLWRHQDRIDMENMRRARQSYDRHHEAEQIARQNMNRLMQEGRIADLPQLPDAGEITVNPIQGDKTRTFGGGIADDITGNFTDEGRLNYRGQREFVEHYADAALKQLSDAGVVETANDAYLMQDLKALLTKYGIEQYNHSASSDLRAGDTDWLSNALYADPLFSRVVDRLHVKYPNATPDQLDTYVEALVNGIDWGN